MEGKKSFVLYADLITLFEKLPNDKAGELIKHIFQYVNDQNPQTDDLIIQIAFEPIKLQLKRDLLHWKSICERNSDNGKRGGRPRKNPKNPVGSLETQENPKKPKKADNDNDNDNDNDIIKKNSILLDEEKPSVFGKPEINSILELIKTYNNGIIDGTIKEQRRFGNLLIGKLNKIEGVQNGKYTSAQILEIILKIISKNSFHSHKIVGPKKIFYELAGLMQVCKQDFEKENSNKIKEF